jgi:hypothetical protein
MADDSVQRRLHGTRRNLKRLQKIGADSHRHDNRDVAGYLPQAVTGEECGPNRTQRGMRQLRSATAQHGIHEDSFNVATMSVIDKPSMAALIEQAPFQRARFAGDLRDRGTALTRVHAGRAASRCVALGAAVPAFAFEQMYDVTGMHGVSLRW